MNKEQEYNRKMRLPIDTIVYHHSGTPRDLDWRQTLKSINTSHKGRLHKEENGLLYHIAYHYLIFGGGLIIRTRPEDEVGYHASNWGINRRAIGICFIGNFEKESVNNQQITAGKQLTQEIRNKYRITKTGGHRDFAKTTCPGKNFDEEILRRIK